VNDLKVLLAPFLPFSGQRLHDLLGYEDVLAPLPEVREYEEEGGSRHAVLGNEYEQRDRWHHEELPAGRPLKEPRPLYRKLDRSVVDEELARMEGSD
jgi:methionyl-tRNA synthetase